MTDEGYQQTVSRLNWLGQHPGTSSHGDRPDYDWIENSLILNVFSSTKIQF